MSDVDNIKRAVEYTAQSAAEHLETVQIVETFQGETIWAGNVEVFRLMPAPPDRAYGWVIDANGKPEYVAVLGMDPIDSPIAAVRAWLVSLSKRSKR
jgi:hypothetical protein